MGHKNAKKKKKKKKKKFIAGEVEFLELEKDLKWWFSCAKKKKKKKGLKLGVLRAHMLILPFFKLKQQTWFICFQLT